MHLLHSLTQTAHDSGRARRRSRRKYNPWKLHLALALWAWNTRSNQLVTQTLVFPQCRLVRDFLIPELSYYKAFPSRLPSPPPSPPSSSSSPRTSYTSPIVLLRRWLHTSLVYSVFSHCHISFANFFACFSPSFPSPRVRLFLLLLVLFIFYLVVLLRNHTKALVNEKKTHYYAAE